MAVLKYERFIVKMSTEQKVRLITSTQFFKSSSAGSYEFPVFNIKNQPYDECDHSTHITHFPCDLALASAWNPALTDEVYAAAGEEAHAVNSFAYYDCTNGLQEENLTSEHFVLGKFLARKVAGLRRGNAFVNFRAEDCEDENERALRRSITGEVLTNASPSSVIFSDVEEAETVVKRFSYGDLVFGVASTVEEALDFLYSGASFLFLSEDITDALANKLTSLTSAYKQAHSKYVSDKMSESSFARLVRNFKIFNGEILDKACDDVINIVLSMQEAKDNPQADYKSLRKGEAAVFDEINHNELAVSAARQSAVLLKNEGGVLPLQRSRSLAVLGEYAKDVKYQRAYYKTRATAERLAFDAINDYELNTVGFGLGYAKGERGRSDLLDHAVMLVSKADCALVYLAAERGASQLPPEQLELLNAVCGKRAKIIAVVAADNNIDMSFAAKCDAVLLTYASGQGGTVAALDILTGVVSPSGKLTKPLDFPNIGGTVGKCPVGYGLSYTRFEYTNLKVNESGVSFTVKNVGPCDGFAVPQLFVKKKNTSTIFADKQLKGFTKAFVKQGDAVRVKIPFDDNTFSIYDAQKGYHIEGGLYTVTIGDTAEEEKLSGILLLKDYEDKHKFDNTVVQSSDDGRVVEFSESNLPASVKSARKRLPFALKLVLAIMLAVYADAVLILFAVGNIVADKDVVFYAVIGVVALVVNALVIIYIAIASTRRKAEKFIHPNVVLTEMLDNVEEFTEIAKVKYKLPVEEAKKQEEEVAEQTEEQAAEQALAATYEVNFDDASSVPAAVAEKVSFGELCRNLRNFALNRGINLEITSARVLVSAIASCKIVFLTSKNAELLPDFVKVLNEYYGNETPVTASDEWKSLSDILWCEGEDEGKFVLSPFSNAVYGAHKAREQERVLLIDNVNVNNLGSYFCNFLEHANHPTEEYVISFNEETSFKLPDNLTYVLVPQNGSVEALPAEILNASMIAEVMLSKAEITPDEQVEPKIVSHEDFRLMLSTAKEIDFVSERIWKKVDALAETITATEKFAIGNKNTIQLESFTSVMIDCGADEAEAVTNMFLVKLAYILKNTRMYRQDGGDKSVYAIIEKLFADEELAKIKRVLIKAAQV